MPDEAPDQRAKRDELVDAHRDVYASTLAVMRDLSEDQWALASGCPGWTVHDLLSHMIGVERLMLGDPRPAHAVEPMPDHVRNAFGQHTEIDVDLRRARTVGEQLAEATETFGRRVAVLDQLTPDQLGNEIDGLLGRDVAAKVLGVRLFDLYAHEQDVRRATGRPGHQQGPAPEVFWRRSLRGVRATLQRAFTDLGTIQFLIDEPERREGVVELGAGPATTLTLDWSTWMGLVCGRADARPERVAVDGDDAAAATVLGAMAITP